MTVIAFSTRPLLPDSHERESGVPGYSQVDAGGTTLRREVPPKNARTAISAYPSLLFVGSIA
jgi:hypothetical protein